MTTQQARPGPAKWSFWHTLLLFVIVVGTPFAVWWILSVQTLPFANTQLPAPGNRLLWVWWTLAIALTLVAVVAGGGITGRWLFGWLINEQYRMSLSRLQMFLWTVTVLASLATAVAMNLANGHLEQALEVAIPTELWLVIGISTTSLVASPLILADKKRQPTNIDEAKRTLARADRRFAAEDPAQQEAEVKTKFVGQLKRNATPDDASFADLLRGEQTGNADVLDVARLQNLFFTLILLLVYVLALLGSFEKQIAAGAAISEFPPLNAAFTALLGISTTGYLAAKGVNYQPPGNPDA